MVVVVLVVVVVGPWYWSGTWLLDELDVRELDVVELLDTKLDELDELDELDDEPTGLTEAELELELEVPIELLLVVAPYCGGTSEEEEGEDELETPELLDPPE